VSVVLVYLLFFLSGISGLVYQVVWVREFGSVFGNTVYSASAVTAVFMCGLGVGSFVVGRLSDRRHALDRAGPLRTYGYFELGIAALGLLVALSIPELEALSARVSSYRVGPEGWFELSAASLAFRYATAIVLLLPITFLMGGTLTLLIRFVVSDHLDEAGWRIGALYGLNTAGAAFGAFMSDFALIPNLGILLSQGVAIGLNLVAGIGALWLARGVVGAVRSSAGSPPAATAVERDPHARFTLTWTALTLFLSGFVAMGFEIVWFRYLISMLGGFRGIFSLLMTVILVGIFLGSVIGGYLERRTRRPVSLFLAAQTGFILAALAPMALLGPTVFGIVEPASLLDAAPASLRGLAETVVSLPPILAVVAMPALLMGCTFPLTNAHVQRVEASLGTRAGLLYLANTTGNVAGALSTGFVLLPVLGQQGSVALLTCLAALGLVPIYLTVRRRTAGQEWVPLRRFAACILLLGVAFTYWLELPPHHLLKHVRHDPARGTGARVIAISEGINESAVVLEGGGSRALYTNGHPMSGNGADAQRYMRLFSHLPLLSAAQPERILVICFGVGTTLHAASLHSSVEELEVVDLSKNVLQQAHHFAESNGGVLESDRVRVFVNDGRQHLRMQPTGSYDLITLEPPPIANAGVASLYSVEFYELARSRLRPGGFMTQWLPAYQVGSDVNLSIIRSFIDVFPNAALLSGYERELILIGRTDGPLLDAPRVRARLERDAAVHEDLERVGAGSLTALVASFVAGPGVLERATREAVPVSDDLPVMEYATRSSYVATRLPAEVFDSREVATWCPDCFGEGGPIAELGELPRLVAALEAYHRSDAFLEFSNYRRSRTGDTPVEIPGDPCALVSVRESSYFSQLFDCAR